MSRILNAQSSENVSAFAARKQTAPLAQTTNDTPKRPSIAPLDRRDQHDGPKTDRKRKKAPIPAVNEYIEAQQQKSKRGTQIKDKTRIELSEQFLVDTGSSKNKCGIDLAATSQDGTASAHTLAVTGPNDLAAADFQEHTAQKKYNDGEHGHHPKTASSTSSDGTPGDDDADYQSEIQNLNGFSQNLGVSATVVRQLSTFVPSIHNVIEQSGSEWTISLETGDTVTLVGAYDVWIRKGAISILGAILHQSSIAHRIYAPSIHSLPSLKPIWNPYGPPDQQTIITVCRCNSGLGSLRQVSSKFGRIWNCNTIQSEKQTLSAGPMKRSFQLLNSSVDDAYKRPVRPITIQTDWQKLISTLALQLQPNRLQTMLVCGPKGSGKSTFSRILANAILTKPSLNSDLNEVAKTTGSIALLDIDPGQPEFSPPGEISLVKLNCCNFGPPFTHPAAITKGVQLIRSHHIGAVTPSGDPGHYLQCVLNLFLHYKRLLSQHSSCPLIVNTAGWIQGSGLEILLDLLRSTSPTDVIYTSVEGPPEVIEAVSQTTDRKMTSLHFLTSRSSESMPRNSKELRMMQTLSYFHLDEPENDNLRWNAKPINEANLLSVHYAGPRQSIYGILLLGHELDPEFLAQVLEGCIVGLVVVEDDAVLQPLLRAQILGDETEDEMSNHAPDQIDSDSPKEPESPNYGMIDRNTANNPSLAQGLNYPTIHSDAGSLTSQRTSSYNHIPSLPRTTSHIPYIPSANNFTPPLSPAQTRSLGQAFVHSIDTTNHMFNLITPVPSETLNALHQQQKKVLIVRGTLDHPAWAYKEDLYLQIHRRKMMMKEGLWEGDSEAWGRDDTRRWAAGKPWMRAEGRAKGERVRRSRRDLGRKKG